MRRELGDKSQGLDIVIGDLRVKRAEVDRVRGGGMRRLLKDPRERGQTKHLIAARPGWTRRRGVPRLECRGEPFSASLSQVPIF